jgi:hypothetical protein
MFSLWRVGENVIRPQADLWTYLENLWEFRRIHMRFIVYVDVFTYISLLSLETTSEQEYFKGRLVVRGNSEPFEKFWANDGHSLNNWKERSHRLWSYLSSSEIELQFMENLTLQIIGEYNIQ